MVEHCRKVVAALAAKGVNAGLVNCRFVKPLDREMLRDLTTKYRFLVTAEENTLRGGFGSGVYEELGAMGITTSLHHLGLPDHFILHGSRGDLFKEVGLSVDQME